jgi:hypothetical protein
VYPAEVPVPYIDLSARTLLDSVAASGRRLQQAAATTVSVWPNTGSGGNPLSVSTVLGPNGSAVLGNVTGTPYVTLTNAFMQLSGSLSWNVTGGGGWSMMAVVNAPATGPAGERIFEFSQSGAGLVDAVVLGRAGTSANVQYNVTAAGGASDTPVSASFGSVFGGGWTVLTATSTANTWAVLVDGAVVAQGNTTKPLANRATDQFLIGKSADTSVGLANGLQLRELSVWFEPLSLPQLSQLNTYAGEVWGIDIALPPPSPPSPAVLLRPPLPPYPGPVPFIDLTAMTLAAGGSGGISARRLQQTGVPLTVTAWPNAGSGGQLVSATAVIGTGGSVELSNSSGKPYVTLNNAYMTLDGTLNWDTTAGGGWTVMAVVNAPATGVSYERVVEFAKAGVPLVDAVILGRADTPGGAAYAVTGAGGISDRPVFASFGTGVFGAGWRVLTATTNATSWALLVDGLVVASGNTSKPVASRTTSQGYIGKSSNADIGLADGMQIRQLSVWFEPLSLQQLAAVHAYTGQVWGLSISPASTPPPTPARPPPPNTCGDLPGGWQSHCPSCAAGTACLRSTCTTGLKVRG